MKHNSDDGDELKRQVSITDLKGANYVFVSVCVCVSVLEKAKLMHILLHIPNDTELRG